jgi:hypothetical protein
MCRVERTAKLHFSVNLPEASVDDGDGTSG